MFLSIFLLLLFLQYFLSKARSRWLQFFIPLSILFLSFYLVIEKYIKQTSKSYYSDNIISHLLFDFIGINLISIPFFIVHLKSVKKMDDYENYNINPDLRNENIKKENVTWKLYDFGNKIEKDVNQIAKEEWLKQQRENVKYNGKKNRYGEDLEEDKWHK